MLPHLKKHLAKKVDSVIYYSVFYHEATVANLLEVSDQVAAMGWPETQFHTPTMRLLKKGG